MKGRLSSDGWEAHQRACIRGAIDQIDAADTTTRSRWLEPLFPGSYLCNQLIAHEPGVKQSFIDYPVVDVSMELVYESLVVRSKVRGKSYVLIDGMWANDEDMVLLYDRVCNDAEEPVTLLVLERENLRPVKQLFSSHDVKVRFVSPDWKNGAEVLSLYRHAARCIFLNTHRVVDAALVDCKLTFISSRKFTDRLSSNVLYEFLQTNEKCEVVGAMTFTGFHSATPGRVIQNSMEALTAWAVGDPPIAYADWIDEYTVEQNSVCPVIEPIGSDWPLAVRQVVDYSYMVRRKALKLAEDPKRFCNDSRYPVIKQLGRYISDRDAA